MKKYWTNLDDLVEEKIIDNAEALRDIAQSFQIRVSPAMQEAMHCSVGDPIYKQFIPTLDEQNIRDVELADPIGDYRFSPTEGVVHRYPDRALFKVTQLCEVYCRFCFRKEMIGKKGECLDQDALNKAYQYFREHQDIWEVILTGGDPLILSNRRLSEILWALVDIEHIQIIRIHTRIPIVNPERIDKDLCSLLTRVMAQGKRVYLVIHANHANEFTQDALTKISTLRQAGMVLLSQSVLLKGVNDSVEALSGLMRTLVYHGIKPYYLHQMDLARGTSHFMVPHDEAIILMTELRKKLSGLCIPHLILEIPEGEGKKVLA